MERNGWNNTSIQQHIFKSYVQNESALSLLGLM